MLQITNRLADPLAGTYRYKRTRSRASEARASGRGNSCRLTVHGSFLIVLLPKEVVMAMGTALGQQLTMRYSPTKIVLVPDRDGLFSLRKHETKYRNKKYTYPQISVPIGPDKPINVKIEGRGPAFVNHEIVEGCLILHLSERVTINTPEGQ